MQPSCCGPGGRDPTAATGRAALVEVIGNVAAQFKRSLTWHNSKEMAEHVEFTVARDVQVDFRDPGHP
jgi:IS30 family transposase